MIEPLESQDQLHLFIIDDSEWLKNHIVNMENSSVITLLPSISDVSTDEYFSNTVLNSLNGKGLIIFIINVHLKLSNGWRQSQAGIDILKHIRYTSLENGYPESIRFAPVILYSFESDRELLRRKPGSLIIYSPDVTFLRIPEGLSNLEDRAFFDLVLSRKSLNNPKALLSFLHADIPDGGGSLYDHSYRNLAGAPKFIKEFTDEQIVPDSDTIFEKYNNLIKKDLAFKQISLIQDNLVPGPRPIPDEWREFREQTQQLRVLYIDDQHEEGWSMGLYAGLRGQIPVNTNFDNNFIVMDSFDAAKHTIDEKTNSFKEALSNIEFNKQALNLAEETLRTKQKDLDNLNAKINQTIQAIEIGKRQFEDAKKKSESCQLKLIASIQTLGDSYIVFEDQLTGKVHKSLTELEQAGRIIIDIKPSLDEYFSIRKDYEDKSNALLASEIQLESFNNELGFLQNELSENQRNRDICKNQLDANLRIIDCFPGFDIIFLDLRLDPVEDSQRTVEEFSGFRLLLVIKGFYSIIPVIVMTASQKAATLKAVRRAGFDAYWIKGRDSGSDLRELIQSAANKKVLVEEWRKLQLVYGKDNLKCRQAAVDLDEVRPGYFEICWSDRNLIKGDTDRQIIEQTLDQCLQYFSKYEDDFTNRPSIAGQILVYLSLIQELRFKDGSKRKTPPPREKYINWTRGIGPGEQEESKFKNARNAYIHEGILPDINLLFAYFGYTIDTLLK